MPNPEQILAGLAALSHDWASVAMLWHAVLALAFIAIAKRLWRPTLRSAALAAAAPLLSAGVFAWVGRNPFNGAVLCCAAIALVSLGLRLDRAPLRLALPLGRVLGASLLLFGFVYPHFVDASSPWLYLFMTPVGLIPCPSLSILIGAGLFCDAFGSRAWGLTAASVGVFYGTIGIARLGVWIDIVLLVGAAALALQSMRRFAAPGLAESPEQVGRQAS